MGTISGGNITPPIGGTVKRSAGSSASGTAGTAVTTAVSISDASKRLVNWVVVAGHVAAANTQLRVTVTYADDSTTTHDSQSAASSALIVTAAGSWNIQQNGTAPVACSALEVKSLAVTTLGTGTGTRSATIYALEVDA